MQPVRVVTGVDRARFEAEILPARQPVVLKGLVRDWPVVKAAQESNAAVTAMFKRLDTSGKSASISILPPVHKGAYFYNDDLTGYNFMVDQTTVSALLDRLLENENREDFVTIYAQSLILADYMPAFEADHPLPVLALSTGPRLWLGNRVRTQTHFDPAHNIACAVAGKRRFTLFPPGQIDNLYPGPFDFAPGGVPVSMAPLENPDFDRYPLFEKALAQAQYADLEPGDALYIPYAWWHHVQSQAGLNALVNYWWNEAGADWISPNIALYAAILTLRDLPDDQKHIWKHMMERYVFGDTAASVAHLPESGRHGFGRLLPAVRARLKGFIRTAMGS
ncbi:cupin-like domain-containing protein [Asticcacaulis sp.]|uniref:cupin-like domain-containing protein n=1 Tax=Asticcacaulis sp. TaxID=1872648 RepID=UPI002C202C1F|nr:cupin-like domain-containing protein [Asticcacaulis sp.]HTM81692.1 cupin-like domain-containing protein [Asticcacaulis sp.]